MFLSYLCWMGIFGTVSFYFPVQIEWYTVNYFKTLLEMPRLFMVIITLRMFHALNIQTLWNG